MATYTRYKETGDIYEVISTEAEFSVISDLITGGHYEVPPVTCSLFEEVSEKEANEYIRLKKGKKS